MPMIPFVPDTLILSGEVNQNFDNTVALDTSRTVIVSHTWNARQNLLGGILAPNGSATQPSLALQLGGTPVGFYHTSSDLIGVAGRLDLPGLVINAGSGIVVAGGTHTSKTISANLSGQSGNQLSFDGTGGLFVPPSASQLTAGNGIQIAGDTVSSRISADANNTLAFGSDNGLFVPPGSAGDLDAGDGIDISGDTISVSLSSDANNTLAFGSDNGLYAPTVTPTVVSAGTGINVTGPAANRTVAAHLSTDQDNAIRLGADDGLYAPLGPIKIVGSVDTAADLPDPYTGDVGDSFITSDDGHIHVWTGSEWEDAGEIRGPPGPATTITAGDGIDVTGTNPNYTVASKLSDDAGNAASFGSDDGIFVPVAGSELQPGQGISITGDTIAAFLSADAGNTTKFGSDDGLWSGLNLLGSSVLGLGSTIQPDQAFYLLRMQSPTGGSWSMAPNAGWPDLSWFILSNETNFNLIVNAPDGATFTRIGGSSQGSGGSVRIDDQTWALFIRAGNIWYVLQIPHITGGLETISFVGSATGSGNVSGARAVVDIPVSGAQGGDTVLVSSTLNGPSANSQYAVMGFVNTGGNVRIVCNRIGSAGNEGTRSFQVAVFRFDSSFLP